MQGPWIWTLATAREASKEGDHEVVAYCAYWAFVWTKLVRPKFGFYEERNWLVGQVPTASETELRELAAESLAKLPVDLVLFDDQRGDDAVGRKLRVPGPGRSRS
jgi:hypothetical protein